MIDASIVRVRQRKLPLEVRRDRLDSLGRTFSETIEGNGAVVFA